MKLGTLAKMKLATTIGARPASSIWLRTRTDLFAMRLQTYWVTKSECASFRHHSGPSTMGAGIPSSIRLRTRTTHTAVFMMQLQTSPN